MSADPSETPQPSIRISSGSPTAEELAALVAVLAAVGGDAPAPAGRRRSAWSDPAWRLAGPGAATGGWRSGALPR